MLTTALHRYIWVCPSIHGDEARIKTKAYIIFTEIFVKNINQAHELLNAVLSAYFDKFIILRIMEK